MAFALGLTTACLAVLVPIFFARRKHNYSHIKHTISELGEYGSPDQYRVAYFGFVPIAVFLWSFLFVVTPAIPSRGVALFSLVGLGYFVGALCPCDPGAPLVGSWRNQIHNLFGGLGYAGAGGGLLEIASRLPDEPGWLSLSSYTTFSAYVVFVCMAGLITSHPYRGLVQRIAESSIFLWVLVLAVQIGS